MTEFKNILAFLLSQMPFGFISLKIKVENLPLFNHNNHLVFLFYKNLLGGGVPGGGGDKLFFSFCKNLFAYKLQKLSGYVNGKRLSLPLAQDMLSMG